VPLADEARDQVDDRRVAEVRRERDSARQTVKALEAENADLTARLNLIETITDLDPRPPRWLAPKKAKGNSRATVTTILSDSHFDEVVNPDEIGGVNAYDRDIATRRLRRYFDQVCTVSRSYLAGVTFDGVVAMLGGDLLSGDIHEELKETNEDTTLGSVLYWSELLAAGVGQLADEFGQVHVPVVVGNHGRRTRKPRAKGRARDNFDWLVGHLVAREFRDDDRVTFDIPDAAHTLVTVHGTTYRLEHGDSARGGSGWMGVLGPAMRRDQKIRSVAQAIEQPFDHLVIGHWHRLSWLGNVIVNGSSKGLDEYAAIEGFGYEVPQQALWLTTPERGMTMQAPVFVADRKREGW
jgi:hypothetical protein